MSEEAREKAIEAWAEMYPHLDPDRYSGSRRNWIEGYMTALLADPQPEVAARGEGGALIADHRALR